MARKGRQNGRRFFGAPYPLLSSESHVEINGGRYVVVEECQGVLAYSSEIIRLSLGKRAMMITGDGLVISGMFGSTVIVEGRVCSVEFL